MIDLDAYLRRIGLPGGGDITAVHRAHATSILFENLDPHRGVPVSLAAVDIERKLVAERRGGYCFEQNLLLAAAMQSLGAEVELLLARVRSGAPPGAVRPRTHLLLRVRVDGAVWHADVGFGPQSLLEPIPFGPGGVHEQAGWRYRVVPDGPEYVLQMDLEGGWADLYGFVAQAVPFIDLETSNWFTCTHPRSPFVAGLVVSERRIDGLRTSLSDWAGLALTEQTPAETHITPVNWEEVPELLATRFALPQFTLGADGRIALGSEGRIALGSEGRIALGSEGRIAREP
jgi:N-hydroxyarylamine O-acetyltransferase